MNRPTIAQLEQELCGLWDLNFTLRQDAKRLDFLDRNLQMKFGWRVSKALARNISVDSVIFIGSPPVSIRAAIDAAIRDSE